MATPTVSYDRPGADSNIAKVERVWYTGKTVHATKASRTNISPDTTSALTTARTIPRVGSVLCRDFYGHDNGQGVDYSRPATAILHEKKVVIVQMAEVESPTPADDGYGRWVDVVEYSEDIPVLMEDGSVTVATGKMGVRDASFALVDLDFPAAGGAAITDSSGGTAGATIAVGAAEYILTLPAPANLSTLSTGGVDVATGIVIDHRFEIISWEFITTLAGTGSGASLVFNLEIGAVNVGTTPSTCTVTLAGTSDIGERTAATTVTGANIGAAGANISLEVAAGGTAFTAGSGYFLIKIKNLDTSDALATLAASLSAMKNLLERGCAVPLDPALAATDFSTTPDVRRCRFGPLNGVLPRN